jgi:hypothetical protein
MRCCPLSVRPTGLADGLALKELRYDLTIRSIRPWLWFPRFRSPSAPELGVVTAPS